MDHQVSRSVIEHPLVKHVQFTGSVKSGLAVNQLASARLVSVGLELGGNDAAFVRHDADPINAAENLVDGAMYNSGQSCCGIQRIFVHSAIFDQFLAHAQKVTEGYVLGSPLEPDSTLGPVINTQSAEAIREMVDEAIAAGATPLIKESLFPKSKRGTAYVAPQLLVNVHEGMRIMKEECFGPVAVICKVDSDQQAIAMINDCDFGLTASIWTKDVETAEKLGHEIQVGTVLVNRCDYVDPGLPWIGVKQSGKGCSLSSFGFDALTRPKGYHIKNHTA